MKEHLQITDWIAQHLTGQISKENQQLLMNWVNANDENKIFFDETVKLWSVSENYTDSFDTNIDNAWDQFESKLEKIDTKEKTSELIVPEAKTISIFNMKNLLRVAAIFLIGTVGFLLFQNNNTIDNQIAFETVIDETKELLLPDGSKVVLNENSELAYFEKGGKRMVELNGEAWFDVMHMEDKKFEILSGEAKTVVLGTAFNVRAYAHETKIEVTVERGKVAFSENANSNNKTELPAGTEGIFYKKEKKVERIEKEVSELSNVSAWRTKTLIFDDLKMDIVIETIEKYYNVNIEVNNPELLSCFWVGIYANKSIEEILEYWKTAFNNSDWKLENGTYYLSGNCDN